MSTSFFIEQADHSNPDIDLELRQLMKAAFEQEDLQAPGYIHKNIDSKASKPSITLVARENGRIIGSNSYLANDFYTGGKRYTGYQVCWAATHPEHQGKRVFININREAIRILGNEEAGFLYALYNEVSGPIFVNKLGFTRFNSVHSRIANIPFLKYAQLTGNGGPAPANALLIDEQQLFEHKKKQSGREILRFDVQDSFIWGKIEKRKKFGVSFNIFIVGGIKLTDRAHIKELFKGVFRAYKPGFIEIISCEQNTINQSIKKWLPSVHGFAYHNLHMPDNIRLNLMFGAIDVF